MERVHISLCAEDPVVRAGMEAMLRHVPELEIHSVVGEPDTTVLVLCVDGVDDQVLTTMRRWRKDGAVRIVLVVGDIRDAQLLDAIECGVTALVRRSEASTGRLVQAIKVAASGEGELPADLLGRLLAQVGRARTAGGRPDAVAMPGLSHREIDVVRLVAEGLETREIAAKLSYSERTIKGVLHGMMLRLDLRNRPHAVAYAAREGFL
ncbi:DNA-binding NarL/FixJ family response regulator [Catenulispora sp. GAS73]|uniref:helix-turn-helix transcriptional regulator n=1 Tax=Catenulispora sp. GAS73 TaxID=3156269 RepID=UPI003515C97E